MLKLRGIMENMEDLKKEIEKIKERNKRVEADKAWETSWTRRILVSILTYIVIISFFYFAGLPNPLLNAIIPTIAFVLSNISLPFGKRYWIKYIYNNK